MFIDLKELFFRLKLDYYYHGEEPFKPTWNYKHKFYFNGVNKMRQWLDLIGMKNPTKQVRYDIWKRFGFCPPNLTYTQRLKILNNIEKPEKYYGPVA